MSAERPPEERVIDLGVELGPVRLPNPVLVASGTFGYGNEAVDLTRVRALGGIVTKTVTLEPRSGNAAPRLHETPSGMINSIGLQNVGIERFIAVKLPELLALGVPIIVSIGGRRVEEFQEVARRLEETSGIAALEINVSCPNVKEGGLEFCQNPASAAAVLEGVRQVTRLALWAKLSPNTSSIGTLPRACEEAGADGLTAVNTFVALAVAIHRRAPISPSGTGGLSGPAIRPIALAKAREVVRHTKLPVIGVGGIASAADALEFLIIGARAVQVGTASFPRPWLAAEVVDGIGRFLREEGETTLAELIGSYRDPRA